MVGIRKRLVVTYSLFVAAIIILIVSFVSIVFPRRFFYIAQNLFDQRADIIADDINRKVENLFGIGEIVRSDKVVIQQILNPLSLDNENLEERLEAINKTYSQDYLISKLVVTNTQGTVFDPIYANPLYSKSVWNSSVFQNYRNQDVLLRISAPGLFPESSNSGTSENLILTAYSQILDKDTYQLKGYLIMLLRYSVFFDSIKRNNNELFTSIKFFNSQYNEVYTYGPEILEGLSGIIKSGAISKTIRIKNSGKSYIIFYRSIPLIDWHMCAVISSEIFYSEITSLVFLVILIGIASSVIAFVVNMPIAKKISTPILALASQMSNLGVDELPPLIEIPAQDEVVLLIEGYNAMVMKIKQQVDELALRQETQRLAEVNALKFELDYLQAQISPHFLHNTLNALSYQAEVSGNSILLENIQSLNRLLRRTTHDVHKKIFVSEEIELLRDFLTIQRLRFGNSFKFVEKVDPAADDILIPQLILQPIVENSLFHGVETLSGQVEVVLTIRICNNSLEIMVKDNGPGMEESKIKEFKGNMSLRSFSGIGLSNVDQRLRLLYGKNHTLRIENNQAGGVSIRFSIPLEQ